MESIDVLHYSYILVAFVASCCFVYMIVLALSSRLKVDSHHHDQQDDTSAPDTPLQSNTYDPPPSPKQVEASSFLNELSTSNSTASSLSSSSSVVIHGANKLKKRNKGSKNSAVATPGSIVSDAFGDMPVPRRVSFTSEVKLSCSVPTAVTATTTTTAATATTQSNSLKSSQTMHTLSAPSLISSRNSSLGSLLKPSGGSLIKQSYASKKGGKESIEVRYAKEVRLIVEMGFEMKEAIEAIEKSLGNVDSAVSWLLISSSELDDKFVDAPPVSIHGSRVSTDSMVTPAAIDASPSAEDEVDTTNESKGSSPQASVEEYDIVNTDTTTLLPVVQQQPLSRAVRSPQPCRHFLTRYGCRQGGRCKFLHDPSVVDGRQDSSTAVHRSNNDTWINTRRDNNNNTRWSEPSSTHQMVTRPDNSIFMDRYRVNSSSVGVRHSNDRRGDNALTSTRRQLDGNSRWLTHAHTGNDSTAFGRVTNMSVDSRAKENNSRWFPNRQFDNSDPYIDLNDTQNLLAFVHKDQAVGIIAAANDPISPEIGSAKNAPKSPVIGPVISSKHSFVEKSPFRSDQSDLLPPARYPIDPSFGSFGSNSHCDGDRSRYRHCSSDTTDVYPTREVSLAPPEEVEDSSRWFGACPPSPIEASTHFVYTSAGLVMQQSEQQHTVESTSSHDCGGHYIYVGGVLKPLWHGHGHEQS